MKLQNKINIIIGMILVVVIISIASLSYKEMKNMMKEQIGKDLLKMATVLSMSDEISNYIDDPSGELYIQNYVEKVRLKTGLEFIVVMDMKGIRYSHPLTESVGKPFMGGDESRVLKEGERYVSEANGNLGISLRAFSPIFKNGKQVGAICTGVLNDKIEKTIMERLYKFIPFLVNGLLLGIIGATFLSRNIKNTLFGLEPHEIALSLKEKEVVFQSISEGIIATDENGNLKLFNKIAADIIGLNEESIGKPISDLVYESKVTEIIQSGEVLQNYEVKIRPGVTLICNYNPLKNEKKDIIGVVVSFQDLTEVKKMAEELTGIKKLMWELRAQNHEFMNKLHTISGLIQLEEYEQAVAYISNIANKRAEVSDVLTHRIKDVSLAGMLLAKYSKAEEAKVNMHIDEDSRLDSLPEFMTSDELVSVVGNLIENSLDAVKNDGTGRINIKIYEDQEKLNILVSDNGPGIPLEIRNKIFEAGFSTKSKDGRGYGMYVIKKIIDEAKGSIELKVEDGTSWLITIPMKRSV